jgi:hypothetical protein
MAATELGIKLHMISHANYIRIQCITLHFLSAILHSNSGGINQPGPLSGLID